MVRLTALALVLAAVLAPAVATGQSRVDVFDKKLNRTGGVIVDERTGRVDVYDRDANRLGYGQLDRATGRVDLFDVHGKRVGSVTLAPTSGAAMRARK